MRFDDATVNDALRQVALKYPHAVIVTGDGRGAEKHVAEFAELIGLEVMRANTYGDYFGKDALVCQVDTILVTTGPIILIGSGERVKRAETWLKRCDSWRDKPRSVWRISVPKPSPKKRAAPRRKRDATLV
jgi:hypothetical protein